MSEAAILAEGRILFYDFHLDANSINQKRNGRHYIHANPFEVGFLSFRNRKSSVRRSEAPFSGMKRGSEQPEELRHQCLSISC